MVLFNTLLFIQGLFIEVLFILTPFISASINTVHPESIDTVHPASIDIVHCGTVHHDTVHPNTVHPVKNNTTCGETKKIEVLILKVDEIGMLRDEEGRIRNNAGQLINDQGQDPFQGLPHQDPRKHIEELEDLVSRSEQNEVSEYHMLYKIFPYSISRDAFSWFSQLQLLDDFIAKRDEQHVSRELSRVEEAGTEDATSTFTDGRTSTSIDITTSRSIDITASTSIDITTSTYIDDSAQKNTDVSSCHPDLDVDREITMEDFLELEEFLELEDGEKLEDLDSSREVTMEDFLELEEWLEDMDQNSKKKLDDDQHTSRGDLETSKASIDRHQPDEIDRQPPHIDRHRQPLIDRHHPPNIDRFPLLDEPHGFIVEMEPIEERVHETEASRNADSKHLRPLTCAEEATGLHKRVKRIHDPVKIVVPCAVVEVESPIPPDRTFLYKFFDDAEATREKEKNDKWDRFLASLDAEYMILVQLLNDIMAKRDEQHVSGELSRVEEAGTKDTNVDRQLDLNVDRHHDLNVDRHHDFNFDRCYNLISDR
ncbi:hypothetical protein F2Q70_00043389 [Brassica cretica]|uniref:Uncharacterized protein n=1 Tax=Brassica cretica TaxID=69181 RepID=A0A8S9KH12_BRACR|nr:hypothetical protein F2Q70_00043389 [Brassica cretica]